jgi:hypothetical protein
MNAKPGKNVLFQPQLAGRVVLTGPKTGLGSWKIVST